MPSTIIVFVLVTDSRRSSCCVPESDIQRRSVKALKSLQICLSLLVRSVKPRQAQDALAVDGPSILTCGTSESMSCVQFSYRSSREAVSFR